jgi:hypothetical protein
MPPPICKEKLVNNVEVAIKTPGCIDNSGPLPMWAAPKGAIWSDTQGWMFHGHQLRPEESDVLRLSDGRVRLFLRDIGYIETGKPSVAGAAMASKLGTQPILGEIEVAPAPLSAFPVRPGDNSLGWTTATG